MHDTWEFIKELTNPESIIRYGGIALLVFVIFAETGLMVGFFLPGDSLVFVAGLICASEPQLMNTNIFSLAGFLMLAAIAGNITGFYFGKKVGSALFNKDDNLIFKKRYVEITRSFYERHGGKSLVLGRFLPIIRTFAPILAGVIKMEFRIFFIYTIVGAILWIGSLSILGYYLGEIKWVKENLEWIVIGLIIVTTIPIIRTYNKEKNHNAKNAN
ncbi:MAG: VTT domain-containing protein [Bacteroidetes bacterium]|nr:VTT domain-containing protein [Bacteroidota bacterium]